MTGALGWVGCNLYIKKKATSKIIEIKENFKFCNIWWKSSRNTQMYRYRQKHISGFIQRRLDFFFISNALQEYIDKTGVLASLCSDHSPIFLHYHFL